ASITFLHNQKCVELNSYGFINIQNSCNTLISIDNHIQIRLQPYIILNPSKATKKELNHYDLALFFAPAQNVKNCIFSDAWGLMGRIVINLCLGVYFAKPEEEKYAARHYMFLTAGKRSATRE
ncbi:hypothetical protein, partial [uncultured Muribaculum sp.]